MTPAALPADLARPLVPRDGRRRAPRCDVCAEDQRVLVHLTAAGPFFDFKLCPTCLDKYDRARAAGVVA